MISRTECAPRKIKRIKAQEQKEDSKSNNEPIYQFYRDIIHPSILRLKNDKDKMNYSIWLIRLDTETSDLRMNLIKALFISLKNNRSFHIFLKPPPKDLSELNLDSENAMENVISLQTSTNTLYNNEVLPQEIKYKRYAAVSPDMCSYSTSKASRYLVQSFYVRSDFPIYTWYNPTSIILPDNIDHNQWELYLNRFDILTEDKEADKLKHNCEEIMRLDQVTREITTDFRWHPYSIMNTTNRPKRSIGSIEIDQDLASQPSNQQHIDETAFNIIHNKTLPGYKMLNPRIYSTIIMPDPNFVFNTTGVKITYKNISRIIPMDIEKCQLDESISRTCPLKCCSEIEDKSTKNSSCNTSSEELIPCSTIDTTLKICPLKQRKCSSEISLKKYDKSTKDSSCNIFTEQQLPCSTIDEVRKPCPSKQRKCCSEISSINEDKSTKDSSCNIFTEQQLPCSTINEVRKPCPSKQQKCCSEISSINEDKSTKDSSCNIFTEQQIPCSTIDEVRKPCSVKQRKCCSEISCIAKDKSTTNPSCNISTKQQLPCLKHKTSKTYSLEQQKCSSEINWKNNDKSTKNTICNMSTKSTCSTTAPQNSQCQTSCINSPLHKQLCKDSKCMQLNKTDHTCFKPLSNSSFNNENFQPTYKIEPMYNNEPIMSSKKQLANSFCSNNQSLNSTNSKIIDVCNNNESNVRNEYCKACLPNSSLNDSSNYDWTMTNDEKSLNQSRVPNCIYYKQMDVCKNNQSKVQNECSKLSYPANPSLNDSSNYNWTMTKDEKSLNQSLLPIYTSEIDNHRNSHITYKERKCNHCLSMEPIHQNSQCSGNQNSTYLPQNSQKTQKNNQRCRHKIQEPHCYTPNLPHLIHSQNESYKNKIVGINLRRNNKCKPRSVSVPCNYNKTYPNVKSKEGKQYYENLNESCPDNLEYGRNNNLNPHNKNTKKSSLPTEMNYLDRNEQILRCRLDDEWDPNVGSYPEFNFRCNDDSKCLGSKKKKNILTKRRTSLNYLPNNQNLNCNSNSNSNYSDISVEIGFNGLNSANFNSSESFTTNTSYSNSNQQRPCNHSELTNSEHFRRFNPFMDGYSGNRNQVDGDCNRIREPMDISDDFMDSGNQRIFNNRLQNSNINFPILDQNLTNLQDYNIMDISSDWEDNVSFDSSRKNIDDMSCCEDFDLNNEFQDNIGNTNVVNDSSYSDSNFIGEDDYTNIRNIVTSPNKNYRQLYNNNNTC